MDEMSLKLFFSLIVLLIVYYHLRGVAGVAVISPSGKAPVCSGGQLELTCNTTGRFLEWSFSFIPNTRAMDSLSQTNQTSHLVVNSSTLTFSRISDQNSLPLMSRLLFSSVKDALNGTTVRCRDVEASETSSTIINIIKDGVLIQEIFIGSMSEEFGNSDVTVTLQLTPESSLYSYHVSVVPQVELRIIGRTTIMLTVSYNTLYNASVLAKHRADGLILTGPNTTTCTNNGQWQPDPRDVQCISSSANCGNPAIQIDHSVAVMGYRDQVIEGSTISLLCPPGLILTGPDTLTCMSNGEWEPDIRNVTCNPGHPLERLSRDGKIAIGSSVIVCVVSSV